MTSYHIQTLTEPDPATFDRLWDYSSPHIDPDPDQPHPEYFLGAVGAEAKRAHVLDTCRYWLSRPTGFLLQISHDNTAIAWIAGEQQAHVLTCYLALIGPTSAGSARWIYSRAVYTAFRDWFVSQPDITVLRSHSSGSGSVYRWIRLVFDRQWDTTHTAHEPQSQVAAYQDAAGTVQTFTYTWQDLDWRLK
jgi:hypothetical protein